MEGIWELLLRVLISVVVLIVLTRIDGAKQISQLTFFDYVVGITVGSIAGTLCLDENIPIHFGVIAISLYMFASILISFITNKSVFLRRVFTGLPNILINKGEIMYKGLKRARFDINDLMRELRSQGYFDISEINYAILESNGQVSVMPKGYAKPVTNDGLSLVAEDDELGSYVILDGKILKGNLRAVGKDRDWLMSQLDKQGIADIKDVMIATFNDKDELSIFLKNQSKQRRTTLI